MHVTVLIPAYNSAQYLPEAIHSVLQQTHRDFDVVIVNDGSTDHTERTAMVYMKNHPVDLVSYRGNRGVTYATHIGIQHCRGPLITILDSDDRLFPNSLAIGSKAFIDPEIGFAWSMFVKSVGGSGWSRDLPVGKSLWKAMMHSSWWKASHQKFFRKDIYTKGVPLNTTIDRSSDYQLVLLLALSGCKAVYIPEFTYWYRMNRSGSLTSQGSAKQRQAVVEIKAWLREYIKEKGLHEPV